MRVAEAAPECPSDQKLVDFVEGRLAGPSVARLSAHVAGCSACHAFFDELTTGERGATRAVASAASERIARAVFDAESASGSQVSGEGLQARGDTGETGEAEALGPGRRSAGT